MLLFKLISINVFNLFMFYTQAYGCMLAVVQLCISPANSFKNLLYSTTTYICARMVMRAEALNIEYPSEFLLRFKYFNTGATLALCLKQQHIAIDFQPTYKIFEYMFKILSNVNSNVVNINFSL